jgi:hypothetical protein
MNAFGKSAGGGRRTAPREVTPLLAVYTSVTRSHSALLVDVSNTGARLRAPELPEAGEDLLVSLSNIRVFGTVAWVSDCEFAIAFEQTLSDEDLASLRQIVARWFGFAPDIMAAIDDWVLGIAD